MKFRYAGPFDEVEVPELGVTVKRGHQVEATGAAAESLNAQADWQKVAPPRKSASKKAASKPAPRLSGDGAGDNQNEE